MPVINVDSSLRAGIQADLADTWRQEYPTFEQQWSVMVKFLNWTTIRHADYGFKESIPFPKFWGYGTGRTRQTFRDRYITVTVYPYELSIPWSAWDETDDQLKDLRTHVQSGTRRFMMLPIKFVSEYMNGTASLLPSLLNTYDGASLYSATDGGGSDRLGVSGGNIVTGSGLTAAGVINDIAAVQRRFLGMLDTQSQPIFDESMVMYDKLVAVIPPALNELFQRVTQQEFIRSDPLNNTSESNFLKGTFRYEICPFLTDTSDWFVFLDNPYYKAFAYRAPQNENDIMSIVADFNNSDHAREFNEYVIHTHVRVGIAPWFPAATIKINN